MNQLTTERRVQIVSALVEGCSIRSIVRMTGASKNTVTKLLVDLGAACSAYQNDAMRNLTCQRVQVDEIWSFVGSKAKNVPADKIGQYGDIWTWTAICADTKLVPCWLVGERDAEYAGAFIADLASRLSNRIQLTSDGLKCYLKAVDDAFGGNIDYSMLIKTYGGASAPDSTTTASRYSPPECTGCKKDWISGNPDEKHVSTSYVERQNLTMRMKMRRFTRLTNAFSKKIENHEAAVALHFMHYNFARIHQTLRSTPAMKAGVADHLWSIEEIVGLLRIYNIN
ncbi:MAG: IS1 family transposase [Planctomycetaceae bacterium]|nr:IS1 family transposase [Planctomycetaceae bacterium]